VVVAVPGTAHASPATAAPAAAAALGGGNGAGSPGDHGSDSGWVLRTTDASSNYAPTFVGNGYLAARVPAAGEGYSSRPVVTQSELAGFYAKPAGQTEQRASLPTWTTLGFGDGTYGVGVYGVPGTWSCTFDEICPAMYGQISGGAFVETSHSGSTVGGYLAGLNTNNTPTVGGTDIVPINGASAGPATVNIRYSNAAGGPQTISFGVNGTLRQLTLPTLASWNDWAVVSVPVTLTAGTNTLEITIAAGDTGRVNVDYLAAYPNGTAAPTKVASPTAGSMTNWAQSLDMRTGTLTTSFDWTAPSGKRTSFTYTVNANQAVGHLGTVSVRVVPHWSGTATAVDEFDGQGLDHATAKDASVNGKQATLSETVVTDGDLVTAAMSSVLRVDAKAVPTTAMPAGSNGSAGQTASFRVEANHAYQITKYVGVASSVDTDRSLSAATPQQAAAATATDAAAAGNKHNTQTVSANEKAWAALWASDISIPGDSTTTAQIHAAMFYLLESTRAGVTWSTSPGGLSSDGYSGHVFWDMETWMYPSLLAQHPDIAVGADAYRQRLLPGARANAAATGWQGARFPWESASKGDEQTPTWADTGLYEIHITADVALAQWQYYQATGDKQWLATKAWPVLEGAAQFWTSRVTPNGSGGYDIDDVIAADEYAVRVDDNAYTNVAAATALRIATQAAQVLGKTPDPRWATIADGIVVPFDPTLGIHPEYAGYSGQTIKQADVVMLQYPWRYPMPDSVAQADLDYYVPRTDVGGPSMTDAIHAIDTAELGTPGCATYTFLKRSVDPFMRAPFDQFSETRGGGAFTFTTGAGGFLQEFLYGFTGMRWSADAVQLDPMLPPQLPGVELTGLAWQGRRFDISVGPQTTKVMLVSGDPLPVQVAGGATQTVATGATLSVATRRPDLAPTFDLARCAPVTASSADVSYPAVAAVDGSAATQWRPTSAGASLTVDLGSVRTVRRVTVVSGTGRTTGYTLEGSTDASTWRSIGTVGAGSDPTSSVVVAPTDVRYVRYTAAAGTTPQVASLEVVDTSTPRRPARPPA